MSVENPIASAGLRNPIAFAMDYPSLEAARAPVERLVPHVGMLKVGLELFIQEGAPAMAFARATGLPVFLDLKLHDIPETVERAVARASELGASFLTVHAQGGGKMLERAVARADKDGAGLRIAAVTVLTSLDDADLEAQGVPVAESRTREHATRLAKLAHSAGVTSFICSAQELRALRGALGADITCLTPGIRPRSDQAADQKRIAGAREAMHDGATWLVVGRPLRDAKDPVSAAKALLAEATEATDRSPR